MSISNAAELLQSSSFPSPTPTELGATWLIARSRPRQAKLLAEDLAAHGVRCYFPTAIETRYYAGRPANVRVPLFGDVVFVFGSLNNLSQVQRTGRVVEVLPVADGVTMTRQLRQIDAALQCCAASAASARVCDHDGFGQAAEVRSGPFQGIRGSVSNSLGDSALLLAVSALGRAVVIDLRDAQLDRIGSAPEVPQFDRAAQSPPNAAGSSASVRGSGV